MNFTHLHVHSHYSTLDGMSKVPALVDKCQRCGMHSMALTDHGNMFGIKEFLDYSKKVNNAPKKAVKECKENIQKCEDQIAKLPEWEKMLSSETDEHEKHSLQVKIEDAKKAIKNLPLYKEQLISLQEKADNFVPFKPIVGVEAYCARRSRLLKDKTVKETTGEGREHIIDRGGWHLILLAKNKTGYKNLCKMVSLSYIDGFYDRPRIDKDLLAKYHEGVIVSSACLGGELPQLILKGKVDEAEKSIRWFKSVFGDDYYIELQRHKTDKPGGDTMVYQRQLEVNPVLIELARKTGTKIICTNDAHFIEEEHAEAHDRLICVSTGKNYTDQNRMHYTKQEWLKTPQEMETVFSDLPEALENTQEIADKIEVYSIDSEPIMPKFAIPESFGTEDEYRKKFTHQDLFDEFTQDEHHQVVLSEEAAKKKIETLGGYDSLYRIKLEADYLSFLTWKGAHERYGEQLTDEQTERIIFELHIMKTMGFPGYFLIVMDYIRAAREELDVSVGPGRGSAAGSVVAYCLRITDVDPLKYDLLFERFLNPDRISLPDIDVDFDDAGRARVFDWVIKKYGVTHVAHIITYNTMATKAVIADMGRVQGVPLSTVNAIKNLIPDKFPEDLKDEKGKNPPVNLHNCYKYVDQLKAYLNSDDRNVADTLHFAEELENTIRGVGVHACGLIIGADDLTEFAPLATVKDPNTGQDQLVTEYDGHVVESVGLIKMDFLGLKTLTIIKETLANIWKSKGIKIDIDHIPLDDELTYKLFQEGKTVAIFQFESPGMQKYLRELKPTAIGDLIAMNALYRPGPMDYIPQFIQRKQGKEPITYDLPCMEKYLKETYGVTVYQEQVMLLSRLIADFTRGQSDQLRKAMGKKQEALLTALYPKFIEGGKKNGHNPAILDKIWKDWLAFAKYAFNKSHATCYAWLAYQTAYLKAHYPAEFMAANLTLSKGNIADVTKFMDECKVLGMSVLEPDVNESDLNFTVNTQGDIRFGLGGIKGVGESAVQQIISERDRGGKYKDLFDFLERVNLQACNRKTIENLVMSGAFDCFKGLYREQLVAVNSKGEYVLDTLVRYGNNFQAAKERNTVSLFGDLGGEDAIEIKHPEIPQAPRATVIERLNVEKQLIGICLSAHPLEDYEFEIKELCNSNAEELNYFDKFRKPEQRNSFSVPEGKPTPTEWLANYYGKSLSLGGIITKAEELFSQKKNRKYGRYTLEDYYGSYEFFLFGDTFERVGKRLSKDAYVVLTGKIQQRGEGWRFFKQKSEEEAEYEFAIIDVQYLNDMQQRYLQSIDINIPIEHITPTFSTQFVELCKKNPGNIPLQLSVYDEVHRNVANLTGGNARITVNKHVYRRLVEWSNDHILTYFCTRRAIEQ